MDLATWLSLGQVKRPNNKAVQCCEMQEHVSIFKGN